MLHSTTQKTTIFHHRGNLKFYISKVSLQEQAEASRGNTADFPIKIISLMILPACNICIATIIGRVRDVGSFL